MPAHHEILGDNADAKIRLLATHCSLFIHGWQVLKGLGLLSNRSVPVLFLSCKLHLSFVPRLAMSKIPVKDVTPKSET